MSKPTPTKLSAIIQKALNETRMAEMAASNADSAIKSADTEIFMSSLCVHKARLELENALRFLRRKKAGP